MTGTYHPLGFQDQLHLAPVDIPVRKLLFPYFTEQEVAGAQEKPTGAMRFSWMLS